MVAECWYCFKKLAELMAENPKLKQKVRHGRDTCRLPFLRDGKFLKILEPQTIPPPFLFLFSGKKQNYEETEIKEVLIFYQTETCFGALKGDISNLAYGIVLIGIFVKFKSIRFCFYKQNSKYSSYESQGSKLQQTMPASCISFNINFPKFLDFLNGKKWKKVLRFFMLFTLS